LEYIETNLISVTLSRDVCDVGGHVAVRVHHRQPHVLEVAQSGNLGRWWFLGGGFTLGCTFFVDRLLCSNINTSF
jgi:hypothetical protein